MLLIERTQIEKDNAQRDLNVILEKKKIALEEIEKQSNIIKQRNIEEAKKIGKFRIIAQDKENTIKK